MGPIRNLKYIFLFPEQRQAEPSRPYQGTQVQVSIAAPIIESRRRESRGAGKPFSLLMDIITWRCVGIVHANEPQQVVPADSLSPLGSATAESRRYAALRSLCNDSISESTSVSAQGSLMRSDPTPRSLWPLLFGLFAILMFSSCSTKGTMTLHNASSAEILIERGRRSDGSDIRLPPGATLEVQIDPLFGGSQHVIRTREREYCFSVPRVDPDWIKPGFFHATVLAVWTEESVIHLYLPKSSRSSYFKNPPSEQPDGFPLQPHACEGSSANGSGHYGRALSSRAA